MSASQDKHTIVPSKSRDLWARAIGTLTAEDQSLIDFNNPDCISVLQSAIALAEDKRRQCLNQRWRIRRGHGRNLILRDVFGKIVVWIQKFKEIGDVAVQYDPVHASLPWAGVRLLLEVRRPFILSLSVSIKDNQIFGAMIEGVEVVASLISRYAILEDIYLRGSTSAIERLADRLTILYAAVLAFLIRTIHYFGKITVKRLAQSIVTLTDTSLDAMMGTIDSLQRDVDRDAQLIVVERQNIVLQRIQHLSSSLPSWYSANSMSLSVHASTSPDIASEQRDTSLLEIMKSIQEPFNRMADQLVKAHDALTQDERSSILRWLSAIPYAQHHENVRKGRLQDSGMWLFEHEDFRKWLLTSYSSILWVHGPPGTGKTKLMSVVIDDIQGRNDLNSATSATLAYFYCAREAAEPERADPEKILLSIARQLSGTGTTKPICEATRQMYDNYRKDGITVRSLSLNQTVALILDLLGNTPATIIVDALDECDPSRRHELLDSFDEIIQKSANVVKILVSSRDDGDIHCRLKTSPNLYINAKYNTTDIKRFIRFEIFLAIERKRLLSGRVSGTLQNLIIETLESGAHGMFRWVSLQLQNLCDPRRIKVEEDLLAELGRLPQTLKDLYDRTYEEVLQSANFSRSVGIKLLKWLLVARRTLRISEILAAVSPLEDGTSMTLTPRDVLNMTCNLVVEDKALGCFRFAHLSVREYLDTRPEFSDDETHRLLAERCLDHYVLGYPNDPLRSYSSLFWPTHYASLGRHARNIVLHARLRYFLFHDATASVPFQSWRYDIDSEFTGDLACRISSQGYVPVQVFEDENHLGNKLRAAANPFLTACIFGFPEVLQMQAKSYVESFQAQLYQPCDVPASRYYGLSGLHIAILGNFIGVTETLLQNDCKTSHCTAKGETPLYIAASCRNTAMIRLLLGYHANPNGISYLHKKDAARKSFEEFQDDSIDHRTTRATSSLGFHQDSGRVLSVIDEDSEAPIHLIARLGDNSCLSELLQHGADVNAKTALGSNALHIAILGGHYQLVEMLATAGADVNAPLMYGRLPLHLAAATGNKHMVSVLVRHGADPQKRDSSMCSAFDVATRYGHGATAARLEPLSTLDSSLAKQQRQCSLHDPGQPSSLAEPERRYSLHDPGQPSSLAEPERRYSFHDPGQASSIPITVTDTTAFQRELDAERRNDAIMLDLAIKANQEEIESESVAAHDEVKTGRKAHRIIDKAIATMSRSAWNSRKNRE